MSNNNENSEWLPRTSFSIFIIDLPRLRGKALESAARNYLVGLYPENINERKLVIRKNKGKKGSFLVFVLAPEQAIKTFPISTLFIAEYFKNESAKVLFLESNWIELILIKDGALVKSEIIPRGTPTDHIEGITNFFDSNIEKLDIFCQKGDSLQFNGAERNFTVVFHNIKKEQKKIPVHKYSLFKNLSKSDKIRKKFLIFLFAALIICSLTALYKYQMIHEAKVARIKQIEEEQKQRIESERMEKQRLFELQERYHKIIEDKVSSPYETADIISRCLDNNTLISTLTMKDGFFQMEAQAIDSLDILKAFENNPKILNPTLQQIYPTRGGERFTINGTVLPEKETVDPMLSIWEQTALFEALIDIEENIGKPHDKIRPSAFGVNIRGLLKKWNCVINTYQYFNSDANREIEFSIKAASNSFFNFLKEASENNGGWIFTLVQIRNLAPQNAIEAVFRVKAETVVDNIMVDLSPYEESPATQISRYFFTPIPQRVTVEKVEATPQPPPVSSIKPEQVSWLEYIGTTSDNAGNNFIYIKNTKTGDMIRLEDKAEGDARYLLTASGAIEIFYEEKVYEIKRR